MTEDRTIYDQPGINLERMRQLLRVVESIPAYKFDITRWFKPRTVLPDCGCAIGWALTDEWFEQQGFAAFLDHHGVVEPAYLGARGFTAVEQFFGISSGAAEYLFHRDWYVRNPKPKDVAARIKRMIERNEPRRPLSAELASLVGTKA